MKDQSFTSDTPSASPLAIETMVRNLAAVSQDVDTEHTDVPLTPVGSLPPGLDGVLFRNGPGRFGRGGVAYRHPFDGDGHLVRIEIADGRARYTNRFVRTAQYLEEERAGRMLYRSFGTNLPGGARANLMRMAIKNAANTHVVWHGGRLLALWEGGLPHRIDPHTLATLGAEDFDGALASPATGARRRSAPPLPFAAHPRRDAATGEMIGFGLVFGRPSRLALYRVDRQGVMDPPRLFDLPRFGFVHDIAVTRRWICVLLPHAAFDLPRAMLGLATPVGSLKLATHEPMEAVLIPRDGAGPGAGAPRRFATLPGFVFHIAQAFDRADGALVLDVARFRRFPVFDDWESLFARPGGETQPRLERLVLDPERGCCAAQVWSERPSELPTAAPGPLGEPRRYLFSLGAPPGRPGVYLTAVQRLDTETGELIARDFGPDLPGEPLWVEGPEPGEAGGWLLSLVNRIAERRSELVILRAADLSVQASLPLPHAVPPGFHGDWVPRAALAA